MIRYGLVLLVVGALGCERDRNPENSAICGLSSIGAASLVIDQFSRGTTVLETPPPGMTGVIPARVTGYGTTRAFVALDDNNQPLLGYEGEGFPSRPGFAVALVDDSAEVFRGVLIFDSDGPVTYPVIGSVVGADATIPLYGMRIRWEAISDDRCPLFANVSDSATAN